MQITVLCLSDIESSVGKNKKVQLDVADEALGVHLDFPGVSHHSISNLKHCLHSMSHHHHVNMHKIVFV